MSIERHSYHTLELAAEACARRVTALLEGALFTRRRATFAISGGITPKHMLETLAAVNIAWDRVHLFWVDERAVPPDDPRSNYRLAEETLILPAHVPRQNAHRIQAELTPELAARRYADEIREFFGLVQGEMPQFDVVHCGVGSDAHIASLFPGEPLIGDRAGIAAAVHVEKFGQWRITLLPGPLLAAAHTVFLVAGDDKAEAVRAVFHEPYNPKKYPAQINHGCDVAWYLDDAAARLLD